MLTLDELRAEAVALLETVADGEPLDQKGAALIGLAVHATPSVLDMDGTEEYAKRALDAGANAAQVHEILVMVSGLGVHTLMEGSRRLAALLRERGDPLATEPLDDLRKQLWDKHVGDSSFWDSMEREVPHFLDSLLRLSPEAFTGFFDYCAIPWKTATVPPVLKELAAMAVDATPTHRYGPGMRLHLGNAIKLGAGRKAVLQTLDIAASAPLHDGVR